MATSKYKNEGDPEIERGSVGQRVTEISTIADHKDLQSEAT